MSGEPVRAWCERVVRFVAGTAVDPHRHFEQRLVGELEAATDPPALADFAARVAGWTEGGLLDDAARRRLADTLAADGLPSPALFVRCPALAAALADPATPAARIAALCRSAAPGSVGDADLRLVRARGGGGLPAGPASL